MLSNLAPITRVAGFPQAQLDREPIRVVPATSSPLFEPVRREFAGVRRSGAGCSSSVGRKPLARLRLGQGNSAACLAVDEASGALVLAITV